MRWFVLSMVVLLAHLALLGAMPTAVHLTPPSNSPPVIFSARVASATDSLKPQTPSPVAKGPDNIAPRKSLTKPPTHQNTSPGAATVADRMPSSSADDAKLADASASTNPDRPAPPADPPAQPPAEPEASPRAVPPAFNSQKLSDSVRLSYVVKSSKFPFPLSGELLWRNQGSAYSARLRYSILGQTRMQTSQGSITPTGLAPERFADTYRSEVAAHFNHVQGKVTFSANTPDAELLPGAQDRLSVLVQLGALVASAPERYTPGSTLSLQTVGSRSADVWLFTVIQSETLDLPGGSVQGLRLERNPRQPYDQKVEVWLSPELGYLPARVRITEANGDSIDQQWQSSSAADRSD